MKNRPRPMRRSRIAEYSVCKCTVNKTTEGGTYDTYGEPVSFKGEVWPANGKVQAELYGERLQYIRNIRVQGEYIVEKGTDGQIHYIFPDGTDFCERDGLCLYTSATDGPDYRILSIKPYYPLRMEAEKI